MSACASPFSIHGFPTFVGHISSYRCARNFETVKFNFFTFLSCRIITHMLTAFSITFLTHLNPKKPAIYFWTPVHLYRSDLFNSLAISVTEWPEDRKNRCLSVSTNSAGLHFRERVQKKKRQKKEKKNEKKMEKVQNGQEEYGGKKNSAFGLMGYWIRAHSGSRNSC